MKRKVVAIVQARVGSTRLFGKVLLNLYGKSVLAHDIERIRQSKLIDKLVVATTVSKRDALIVDEAVRNDCLFYRGSEDNVLSRYYEAAKKYEADIVVRITSDCPLIDANVIDEMIAFYQNSKYDLVTNAGTIERRTFPRGLDCEIFSFQALEKAYKLATEKYQKEHVTPYIYENETVYYYECDKDYSEYRWTLDTPEDFILISEIYEGLYKGKHDFYMQDILALYDKQPELKGINGHIYQKTMKE